MSRPNKDTTAFADHFQPPLLRSDSIGGQLVERRMSRRNDLASAEVRQILNAALDVMAESHSPEPSWAGGILEKSEAFDRDLLSIFPLCDICSS